MEGAAAGYGEDVIGGGGAFVKWRGEQARKFQHYLDKSTPHTAARWLGSVALAGLYCLRVYLLQGFYIVTYGVGIYLLNLLIGFLSPQVDPEAEGPALPSKGSDEFKPFIRRLPEFKFCRDDILVLVESRWKFMSRPIHGMAAFLHPFYKTPSLFHEQDLLTLKDKYIARMFDEEEQLQIDAELCSYMNNLGPSFSRTVALRPEATSLALTWWQSYGRQGFPRLTTLALRILSQDCSAGACERNWSAYSLIHTKIRNRLSTSQLEKLVYCRANMRLVRSYHALGTPKQTDPSRIKLVDDPTTEEDQHIRDEQEEILRMLHRELEEVDRRVTRSRARAYSIPLHIRAPEIAESARRKSIRKGKLPIRTPRRCANEAVRLIHMEEEEEEEEDPSAAMQSTVPVMVDPEFDDEGNVMAHGDMLSSASSSSSSDHEFY